MSRSQAQEEHEEVNTKTEGVGQQISGFGWDTGDQNDGVVLIKNVGDGVRDQDEGVDEEREETQKVLCRVLTPSLPFFTEWVIISLHVYSISPVSS